MNQEEIIRKGLKKKKRFELFIVFLIIFLGIGLTISSATPKAYTISTSKSNSEFQQLIDASKFLDDLENYKITLSSDENNFKSFYYVSGTDYRINHESSAGDFGNYYLDGVYYHYDEDLNEIKIVTDNKGVYEDYVTVSRDFFDSYTLDQLKNEWVVEGSIKHNGYDCYILSNNFIKYYFDKETALIVYSYSKAHTTDYIYNMIYEFDNITYSDLIPENFYNYDVVDQY